MMTLPSLRHGRAFAAAALFAATLAAATTTSDARSFHGADDEKPTLKLRASPAMGFSPLRIRFTGQLSGGPDDYEDLYCVTVEWHWGDDTRSSSTYDCEPYEAGTSEITRRYTISHTFRRAGLYEVQLRLKRSDETVSMATVAVQIHRGVGPR